jgi:hypothetical protein
MAVPQFLKRVVAEVRNEGQINTFSAVGDINGDGRPDIVISGRNGKFVWLENMGPDAVWKEHLIGEAVHMECGGCLVDLTGSGPPDIINGGDAGADEIWWWENPGPGGRRWRRRVIAKTGHNQFHDTALGDVTGDGVVSLVFDNQQGPGGTTVYRAPLPDDPAQSPWPGLEVVATGKGVPNPQNRWLKDGIQPEEGLAIGDVDGDGMNEIICGTHWYKRTGPAGAPWAAHRFATGYMTTKVAVGDLDGDGRNEIVLSEGDPCVYGHPEGGKLAWFSAPADPMRTWQEHVLADGLMDAHTLQLADLCGSGRPDILVGEVGAEATFGERPPKLAIWENAGGGRFTRHVVDVGTGIHEGVLADMTGGGALDVVGKPLQGPERYNVHVWYNQARRHSAGAT